MTFTHEMGHIVGGWCCGGTLVAADLRPWYLPYSIFDPDPKPLITLWCGPMIGVAVPFGFALLIKRDWMWFIANFCLLANGAYLAMAWISGDSYLDTTKLLAHGAHPITIGVYCLVTIGVGYVGFRRSCIDALSASRRQSVSVVSDVDVDRKLAADEHSDARETSATSELNGKSTPRSP